MGKKPAERGVATMAPKAALGFESSVPCGCCGAPSRRLRPQWRVCANGHSFVRKSDH
jgi:hypothetical protein